MNTKGDCYVLPWALHTPGPLSNVVRNHSLSAELTRIGLSNSQGDKEMKELTKFDALRILGRAYWHMAPTGEDDTMDLLHHKFGYTRRSLNITDLAPLRSELERHEGFNGRMPKYF